MTWTLDDIMIKVRKDLKIESEKFFPPWDLISAINDAIRDAESIIMNEFSDYFLTYADYIVTQGDTFLTLPEDLYMSRIRYLQFDKDGADDTTNVETYKIKKIALEQIPYVQSGDAYKYRLVNDATEGMVINIYPTIREDSSNRIRLWYIRKARELSELTDVCDIPHINYILSHVKVRIMKDEGHPLLSYEISKLEESKSDLIKNVTVVADDGEDTEININHETLVEYSEYEG